MNIMDMRKRPWLIFKSHTLALIICIAGLAILLSSCRKENEENYFKTKADPALTDTSFVTFSKDIDPIFKAKCVSCHVGGTSGGCDLDSYTHTITYMNTHQPNTKLYDYIKDTINSHEGVVMERLELQKLSKWTQNPAP